METKEINNRILGITALAAEYCHNVEYALEMEKRDFIVSMTNLLPRIYIEFSSFDPSEWGEPDYGYYNPAVSEEWYETVRRNVARLMGSDDTYLETFEEDMKYSDTPIAASISEGIADIFQALYNFIAIVKESEGEEAEDAYAECRENFTAYWAQTLCNTLRALNPLRF